VSGLRLRTLDFYVTWFLFIHASTSSRVGPFYLRFYLICRSFFTYNFYVGGGPFFTSATMVQTDN
jgi:hypothetical protein